VSDLWSVEHGEALECLAKLGDETVQALVTDPPYASGGFKEVERARGSAMISHEGEQRMGWFSGDAMGTSGLVWLLRSVAVQASRVLRDDGHLLVFCDWRMIASLLPALESSGLRNRNLLIWEKESVGMGSGFRPMHECCLHLTKGTGKYYAADTGNVSKCRRVPGAQKEHPTEKPADLMRSIVRVVAGPGDLVVDPFCGSGQTGVAAVRLGCRFYGIERDARFVPVSRERLAAAASAVDRRSPVQVVRAAQVELFGGGGDDAVSREDGGDDEGDGQAHDEAEARA